MAKETIQNIRDLLEGGIQPRDVTPNQARVLTYILQCWASGFMPTIREICAELGFASSNGAATHVYRLQRAGYLEEAEDAKSGIMLSDKALELLL